jgi:quinol-cytochrome oxidoreductase complex cytochrome b subunit
MKNYWRPRGSRRAIRQFTLREGLWIVALVSAVLLGILLLSHYLHGEMR